MRRSRERIGCAELLQCLRVLTCCTYAGVVRGAGMQAWGWASCCFFSPPSLSVVPPSIPGDKFQLPAAPLLASSHCDSTDSLADSQLNLRASDWDLFDASTATTGSREDEVSWI